MKCLFIIFYFRSPWSEDGNIGNHNQNHSKAIPKLASHPKSISQSNIAIHPVSKTTNTSMSRSYSHEIGTLGTDAKPKTSISESNLETQKPKPSSANSSKPLAIKELKEHTSVTPEEDICSTDSSVLDDSDVKKKKRKLFTFTKKGKNKAD